MINRQTKKRRKTLGVKHSTNAKHDAGIKIPARHPLLYHQTSVFLRQFETIDRKLLCAIG